MTVPRSRSTDRRYYGVAEAIVTDVNDPEKQGRVKVQYPWFDDQTISDWCRVRQLYAGNGYGTFFVPEVGDEVLVAFVHGDMRLPIVIGGLYNGQDVPSTYRATDKDEKLMRTKAGHELLFDDRQGEHRLHLKTPAGHLVELSDKDKKVTVQSVAGNVIELDDNVPKVTIKTPAGQEIVLDGGAGSVTVKGATVTLDAASVKLGGAGASQPVVLGTAFMALFNAHVHTSTAPGAPTSPPVTPMTPAVLSQITKTS